MNCPKCNDSDIVAIGKFNPEDKMVYKCLNCDYEFEVIEPVHNQYFTLGIIRKHRIMTGNMGQ